MAIITSIQQGTVSTTTSGSSADATISTVSDTTKTLVLFNGATDTNTANSDVQENLCRVDLKDNSTVRVQRQAGAGFAITAYFTVIEFDELVDTIQTGEVTLTSAATATATITAVDDIDLSVVMYQGHESAEASNNWNQAQARVSLTDSTTVTGDKSTTNDDAVINFAVVEFPAAAINNIQKGTIDVAATDFSDNVTITEVDLSNTIVFDGGIEFTGAVADHAPDGITNITLTSTTTIAATRGDNEGAIEHNFTVIEFVPDVLESMARGTTIITGTSANTGIATVDTDFAAVNYLNRVCGAASTEHDENTCGIDLLSDSLVRGTVDDAGGTVYYSYEVWEFVDGALPGGGGAVAPTATLSGPFGGPLAGVF